MRHAVLILVAACKAAPGAVDIDAAQPAIDAQANGGSSDAAHAVPLAGFGDLSGMCG